MFHYIKYVDECLDKMKYNDKLNESWVLEIICVLNPKEL